MGRWIDRLTRAQDRWAKPFGDFNHRWLSALFRPLGPIKGWLSGSWLGHPLHSALTDVPVGSLLVTVLLDVGGQMAAADIALAVTILLMLGSAASGAADYTDTDGSARVRATVHATIMVVALGVLVLSLLLRVVGTDPRTIAVGLSIIGFGLVIAGAYLGGTVAFVFGTMVSRHAFRGAGTNWVRLEFDPGTDLAAIAEATPIRAKAGANDLVIVRLGEAIHAIHAVCAHAGGPLPTGTVVDGCLECPWHGARYRLTDGRVQRGPSLYDQPSYEIRVAEADGYEARRSLTH